VAVPPPRTCVEGVVCIWAAGAQGAHGAARCCGSGVIVEVVVPLDARGCAGVPAYAPCDTGGGGGSTGRLLVISRAASRWSCGRGGYLRMRTPDTLGVLAGPGYVTMEGPTGADRRLVLPSRSRVSRGTRCASRWRGVFPPSFPPSRAHGVPRHIKRRMAAGGGGGAGSFLPKGFYRFSVFPAALTFPPPSRGVWFYVRLRFHFPRGSGLLAGLFLPRHSTCTHLSVSWATTVGGTVATTRALDGLLGVGGFWGACGLHLHNWEGGAPARAGDPSGAPLSRLCRRHP